MTPQAVSASSSLSRFGAFALVAVAMLGSSACAKDSVPSDGTQTDETETSAPTTTATETETETGSTQTDTDDTTNDTNEAGLSFYAPADDFQGLSDCDPFAQDCPEGEKCVPYASTGITWDANKCIPVTGSGSTGDACTYGGLVEATDDCDGTTHCWYLEEVDGMDVGVCTEFCTGTADDPICPDATSCYIANDGSITLCLIPCDPLAQDCAPGTGCYAGNADFVCLYAGDKTEGMNCEGTADCAPSLACVNASVLPDCPSTSCCTSWCDVTVPDACPDLQLECVPFFDPPLPEHMNLGVCATPGP